MSTVYFVTNRNPNRRKGPDGFGGKFNPEAVDNLRFGSARLDAALAVQSVDVLPDDPKRGSLAMFADLRARMCEGVPTLVFVHGYNVSFEEALVNGGRLLSRYGPNLNVVLFTWPSDGSMAPFLAYKRDRTDAAASGPAFARALLKLRDFVLGIRRGQECSAPVYFMAHSMGNYVLRHGVQEVCRHGGLPRLFDQIFLMAADEDHDAFEHDHKLRPLQDLGHAVSVYINRGDTALVISDRTKNNPTRLGSIGPRRPLDVPADVTIVDVSELVTGLVEHDYFWSHGHTVADVTAVMRGTPQDLIGQRRYVASQNRYVLVAPS